MLIVVSGPTFHPANTMPKAPCALCALEKEDSSDKKLFQIDDPNNAQLHGEVPKDYFKFPPARLGDNDPGMQALRVSLHGAHQDYVAYEESSNLYPSFGSQCKQSQSLTNGQNEKDKSCDVSKLSNFYMGTSPLWGL